MAGDIRDEAAIQDEANQVFAQLGEVEYQITQATERKGLLLNRMRELGQEMHLSRKISAGQKSVMAKVGDAVPADAVAGPAPRDPLVAPGSSAREVVAKRADDLKRALENAPPLFKQEDGETKTDAEPVQ